MADGRGPRAFDVWNSSSTGHQRSDSRPGTGWRDARDRALNSQFGAVGGATRRTGSESGRAAVSVARMLRRPGMMGKHEAERREQRDGERQWGGNEQKRDQVGTIDDKKEQKLGQAGMNEGKQEQMLGRGKAIYGEKGETLGQDKAIHGEMEARDTERRNDGKDEQRERQDQEDDGKKQTSILAGVVAYINGSTYPIISDHRLRHLLAQHGAHTALHLARRRVTHVILGKPSSPSAGAGGGLAVSKLEREIRRTAGCAVKFVGVEWVLESVKAGRRLPEARFAIVSTGGARQPSLYALSSGRKP